MPLFRGLSSRHHVVGAQAESHANLIEIVRGITGRPQVRPVLVAATPGLCPVADGVKRAIERLPAPWRVV